MKFILLPVACLLLLAQPGVEDVLKRPILAPNQTRVDTQVWTASLVPLLQIPQDPKAWEAYAASLRQRVLDEVVYRGAAREWRQQAVKVEPMGEIRGDGYIIRKLRFEAVPGLHVPALLYEPLPAPSTPTPVVLNVNGHEGTGVANPYIQARCINLAKKGLYALNVEWIGQGQLASKGLVHYRMNQLDLVGTAGLAVFYESLRRSLDIAVALPHADRTRIGVTGLSGGGWQTIILSALDTRVTLSNPVAGHASYVTRAQWPNTDLGDSEQTPSDLATIADYPHLNALVAPRPLQLTYNAKDNCCFRADYAAGPMLQWATPVFRLLDAAGRFAYHVNHDEGHNYERDNREALYRFLHKHFFNGGAGFDPREIDVTRELRDVAALATPLPSSNADFQTIATRIAGSLPPLGEPRRERLSDLLRARRYKVRAAPASRESQAPANTASWRLHMEQWTVPLVELGPAGAVKGTTLVLADEGRGAAGEIARRLLGDGRRVAAMDPFYFGESALGERDFLFGLLVSALGERPLGIQASQVAAAARWLAARHGSPVAIAARGPRTSLVALIAAALEPEAISGVELNGGWRTLREVLDRSISAEEMPEMFAFGLLAEFDVPQIERLVRPRPVVYR